jgi:hypothetical protein
MIVFWLGLAFLFIAGGLFICTQNTQTVIGVPMVVIGVVIILVLSLPARAHDSGQWGDSDASLRDWYQTQRVMLRRGRCLLGG